MLVSGREVLDVARSKGFAVPAFNISDFSMLNGVLRVSEEKRAPVILAIHPNEIANLGWDVMPSVIQMARKASVPVVIHLDHGASFEQILAAIQGGFTSVMLDASTSPFDDNVALTAKAVEAAHAVGVSVEGELGTIGRTDVYAESGTDAIIYTDPRDAVTFVERTGVDCLAIAIGTRHGIYPSHLKPELKLDLLREIEAVVDVPLVLHGGSNNPDDEMAQAARGAVSKINISSDIKTAYYDKAREVLRDPDLREPDVIQPLCREALMAVAAQKIDLFGATNAIDHY